MSRCDKCKYQDDGEFHACYVCTMEKDMFRQKSKQTNADRIRGKTDEELAEWIETLAHCERCPMMGKECKGGSSVSRATCKLYWLDWLKQEAKENKEMVPTQTLEEGR